MYKLPKNVNYFFILAKHWRTWGLQSKNLEHPPVHNEIGPKQTHASSRYFQQHPCIIMKDHEIMIFYLKAHRLVGNGFK